MANTIQIKRKLTSGAPQLTDLSVGEMCLVVPDEILYQKKTDTELIIINNGVDDKLASSIAAGSTLGLQQELIANAGDPAKTVLAVGYTNTGKVQGVSLGNGNTVEVYLSGADFNLGNVLYREFMSFGEPICFTGLPNGAIVTATEGFYGVSEQLSGGNMSPMPLLSFGLAFKKTMHYIFRSGDNGEGFIYVVNGPIKNTIKLTDGAGVVQLGQENIELDPWESVTLNCDGSKEYIIEGAQKMMACSNNNMDVPMFQDSRGVMPLTNDGITWPRSGNVSAPYNNTQVEFFTRDGVTGFLNVPNGVSPGNPVDFDAASPIGTGANDAGYAPDGATRVLATGLISAYSGADAAGQEATSLMPCAAMSQVVAQCLFIRDTGGNPTTGVYIASKYVGKADIYEWDFSTQRLKDTPTYTLQLTRRNVTVTSERDQLHAASAGLGNETAVNNITELVGDLNPGAIIADVPITVVVQNADPNFRPTLRSQNNTTTTGVASQCDETLMLGHTPKDIKFEIRKATDGLLYKRAIGATGVDDWVQA